METRAHGRRFMKHSCEWEGGQAFFIVVIWGGMAEGRRRRLMRVEGLFDFEYQFNGFGNLFHSVWRHASNQLRFLCFGLVKSFWIQ